VTPKPPIQGKAYDFSTFASKKGDDSTIVSKASSRVSQVSTASQVSQISRASSRSLRTTQLESDVISLTSAMNTSTIEVQRQMRELSAQVTLLLAMQLKTHTEESEVPKVLPAMEESLLMDHSINSYTVAGTSFPLQQAPGNIPLPPSTDISLESTTPLEGHTLNDASLVNFNETIDTFHPPDQTADNIISPDDTLNTFNAAQQSPPKGWVQHVAGAMNAMATGHQN
jgi:hypothetical protein